MQPSARLASSDRFKIKIQERSLVIAALAGRICPNADGSCWPNADRNRQLRRGHSKMRSVSFNALGDTSAGSMRISLERALWGSFAHSGDCRA